MRVFEGHWGFRFFDDLWTGLVYNTPNDAHLLLRDRPQGSSQRFPIRRLVGVFLSSWTCINHPRHCGHVLFPDLADNFQLLSVYYCGTNLSRRIPLPLGITANGDKERKRSKRARAQLCYWFMPALRSVGFVRFRAERNKDAGSTVRLFKEGISLSGRLERSGPSIVFTPSLVSNTPASRRYTSELHAYTKRHCYCCLGNNLVFGPFFSAAGWLP